VIETLGDQLERSGFTVFYAGTKLNPILRLAEMIYKTVWLRKKADYVLIDTYSTSAFWYAFIVSLVCRVAHLRYIPILHGGNLPERLKKSPLASDRLFRYSYANVAVSGYLNHEFKKVGYKANVIPNNIDLSKYPFRRRAKALPKLLWVRSFHSHYNPAMAADVLEKLIKTFKDAELCMVGPDKDGSLKEFIEYVKSKELTNRIVITGKLSKEEWIKLSENYDFFLNTTNYDNTPVSVIEAMALGMCVISTNPGGIPYLLHDKIDACLVQTGDAEEMANQVSLLIQNKRASSTMSISARRTAEKFDWAQVKELWFNLLK
jgi:glycosyltransferase involved in cell wall biosynthesis